MYYDNQSLINAVTNGENVEFTYFNGRESKDNEYACFSHWFMREFVDGKGNKYNCMEQFMMAAKAMMFKDQSAYNKIMSLHSPNGMPTIGRGVKGFIPEVWEKYQRRLVFIGNKMKFGQNDDLWQILDRTGNSVLVEANPFDKIWGIGLTVRNAVSVPPSSWPGTNYFGFELTNVRDVLRKERR